MPTSKMVMAADVSKEPMDLDFNALKVDFIGSTKE